MARKVKLYLDIVNSIDLIEEFLGPINLFQQYSVDLKTKSAIERQLGIIGEAVVKIRQIELQEAAKKADEQIAEPEEPMPYQNEIIGFRHRLIHGYGTIDDSIVWSILMEFLGPLKTYVSNKLEIE